MPATSRDDAHRDRAHRASRPKRLPATAAGIVSTGWKVPKNATIDNYIVTVTGTTTKKSPPDAQGFSVSAAIMTISTLTSSKTTYQRTETMSFSFQPSYPDGSLANTGIGLLTLAPPTGTNITLTANYDSLSQYSSRLTRHS